MCGSQTPVIGAVTMQCTAPDGDDTQLPVLPIASRVKMAQAFAGVWWSKHEASLSVRLRNFLPQVCANCWKHAWKGAANNPPAWTGCRANHQ